jgi:hypothetical protein
VNKPENCNATVYVCALLRECVYTCYVGNGSFSALCYKASLFITAETWLPSRCPVPTPLLRLSGSCYNTNKGSRKERPHWKKNRQWPQRLRAYCVLYWSLRREETCFSHPVFSDPKLVPSYWIVSWQFPWQSKGCWASLLIALLAWQLPTCTRCGCKALHILWYHKNCPQLHKEMISLMWI